MPEELRQLSGKHRFPLHGWLGLAGLLTAHLLLLLGIETVRYWFFPLAWWPYILLVDGLVYRREGSSLITGRLREFLVLLPWSVCLWLVFELFNLLLHNWHYVMVPDNLLQRWLGYLASFATVLPGLFETMELLESWGLFKRSAAPSIPATTGWYPSFAAAGFACILLPLIWPRVMFPLVWGSFFFLLEPINHRCGAPSLMRQWQQGTLRTFYLLVAAGAICGLLWEFWNYWALTKWIYTIPYVGQLKIFEMPLLGFLGFPPFALECYVMMNSVSIIRRGRSWQESAGQPAPAASTHPGLCLLLTLALLAFYLFAFHQIDLHTVASYRA